MSLGRSVRQVRRGAYGLGRVLGDLSALFSGSPKRVGKRAVNKLVGRHVVRRMWWR